MFEVDTGMLYLAVQMPDKSLCRPECPVTVSVIQNAEGAKSLQRCLSRLCRDCW